MALVKQVDLSVIIPKTQIPRATTNRDSKVGTIDYERLKELVGIEGLKGRGVDRTTPDAHREFMYKVGSIIAKPKPLKGIPLHSEERKHAKASDGDVSMKAVDTSIRDRSKIVKTDPADDMSHDIRDHIASLRHENRREKPEIVRAKNIKMLRKLLKKLPFERTATENEQVFEIMKTFSNFVHIVPIHLMKELCIVAQLETWKDAETTIFGNTGLHIILKGTVRPLALPYFSMPEKPVLMRCPTPEIDEEKDIVPLLSVEDMFGTLEPVEGRQPNTRVLTAKTMEPNTELITISCSNYKRVKEQIRTRDQTEKMNLLHSCKTFLHWSKQYLKRAADSMEWTTFPANTIIASEGYKAPFIGIIKSGQCHVLRQVDVMHNLPNNKTTKRTKQVVMGTLAKGESFGEVSIIGDEPIACTIITSSQVKMGVIDLENVKALDKTTRQLLLQSSQRVFGDLTTENIHDEYISQESKREWNEFKHNIVVDVINSRGIRPGYGKWSK